MNKKQLIVAWGLSGYVLGGLIVAIANIGTVLHAIRYQISLFIPILRTVALLLAGALVLIWLLGDKRRES